MKQFQIKSLVLKFEYGEANQVTPLVRRVIAHNPSAFTFYGTGTYKARLQAIEAANAKIQEELDEKKVGVDYKVTQFRVQISSKEC